MRADVAGGAAGARLLRVGAPRRLLLAGAARSFGQPVLRIFGLHDADVAELALRDHLARLPHHRIGGVVVGQHEHLAGLLDQRRELLGIGEVGGQRLVADDVDAGFEKRLGRRIVHVVRRHDRHRLDAVGALRLGLGHFGEGAVAARRIEPELGGRRLGALRVGRQRAGDELELAVHARRQPVHRADEGALAAADHAVADRALSRFQPVCSLTIASCPPLYPYARSDAHHGAQQLLVGRCRRRNRRTPFP